MDLLISIIIPTLNRAHLIEETLQSIIKQTYTNWECIIVDDGSDDDTEIVVANYREKDQRFQFYKRPDEHLPGGNGARNYGFLKSQGALIQWFDSDDIMVNTYLESKVALIKKQHLDFVISKTKYFNRPNFSGYQYNFKPAEVSFNSYATGNVSWFTPDLMLTREIALKIAYNETIKAGQEYNFNCKLLLQTQNMGIVKEFLTLRRHHEASIGNKRQQDQLHYLRTKFEALWNTYLDIKASVVDNLDYKQYVLINCISCYLQSKNNIYLSPEFKQSIKSHYKSRSIYFYLAKLSNAIFGKYHIFLKKLR